MVSSMNLGDIWFIWSRLLRFCPPNQPTNNQTTNQLRNQAAISVEKWPVKPTLMTFYHRCSHSLTCWLIDRVLIYTHWAFVYTQAPPPPFRNTHTHTKMCAFLWHVHISSACCDTRLLTETPLADYTSCKMKSRRNPRRRVFSSHSRASWSSGGSFLHKHFKKTGTDVYLPVNSHLKPK